VECTLWVVPERVCSWQVPDPQEVEWQPGWNFSPEWDAYLFAATKEAEKIRDKGASELPEAPHLWEQGSLEPCLTPGTQTAPGEIEARCPAKLLPYNPTWPLSPPPPQVVSPHLVEQIYLPEKPLEEPGSPQE
jgi:hypothetical protein